MKIFQSVQNQFAILGIDSSQQIRNRKIIFGSILLGLCVSLECAATFQPANEFKQYVDRVYMTF